TFAGGSRVRALREPRMIPGPADAAADLRRDEDAVARDDRRRHAEAADGRLPRDVLRGAPFHRQVLLVGGAVAPRPAPLRPVRRGDRSSDRDDEHENDLVRMHDDVPPKHYLDDVLT